MLKRAVTIIGVACCAAVMLGRPAWATMANLKSYKQTYPGKTASCKTCHEGAVGKADNLNAYGKALQKFKGTGKTKALTIEDYQAFDKSSAGAQTPTPAAATTTPTTKPNKP